MGWLGGERPQETSASPPVLFPPPGPNSSARDEASRASTRRRAASSRSARTSSGTSGVSSGVSGSTSGVSGSTGVSGSGIRGPLSVGRGRGRGRARSRSGARRVVDSWLRASSAPRVRSSKTRPASPRGATSMTMGSPMKRLSPPRPRPSLRRSLIWRSGVSVRLMPAHKTPPRHHRPSWPRCASNLVRGRQAPTHRHRCRHRGFHSEPRNLRSLTHACFHNDCQPAYRGRRSQAAHRAA